MNKTLTLVINCGSSSLKFALMPNESGEDPVLSGLAERLGDSDASITYKSSEGKKEESLNGGDHATALEALINHIDQKGLLASVTAVGHRVVHGGEEFHKSVLIDDKVIAAIERCSPLAPLHNPPNLLGIRVAREKLPALPQVAVFDTAFHQTMEPQAYLYALPMEYYREYGVRRYGFHGTSHRFVSDETRRMLALDPKDHGIVIAHLGNGASATAVKNGESVDTTMGLTPLEGLVMGTRSGDVDPGALVYLANRANMSINDLDNMLNRKSGLLGLSELSNDCRTLEEEAAKGHPGAKIALDVFAHRLARLIGGLAMSLDRLDAVTFTGGIGENSSLLRKMTIERLKPFGIVLDDAANEKCVRGTSGVISGATGPKALVVATNEELMIARDTLAIANASR
ncbi:acetate kinase [Microvirga sp. W0021]|uniref:Acetate kinase n=1 Tax=Hohaiivirga grylli TaxID=3133970 RepID=A0ABV0BGP9_9HYPH